VGTDPPIIERQIVVNSEEDETSVESTPITPGMGKRMLIIGVGVLVLGLIVQELVDQTSYRDSVLMVGMASVVPLVAAIRAVKRRAISVWSPVLYGMAGGAVQLLAILIPLVLTSVLYPDPRHPIARTLFFGSVATCLSILLGAVVGGVVSAIFYGMRAREVEPESSTV